MIQYEKYIVLNCQNCPFENSDFESGSSCNHPKGYDVSEYDMTGYQEKHIPHNCPLLTHKIDIVLTENPIINL
jgi:hypothetical protein